MSLYVPIPPATHGQPPVDVSRQYPNLTFYVSTTGNDTTGDGSFASPWATPTKARDFIRASGINNSPVGDITVNMRAGTYTFPALTNLDSGHNGHAVVYKSVDGPGQAVIDTGTRVTGWTNVSGSVFKKNIGAARPYAVYENGIRSTSARLPKLVPDASYPMAHAPYFRSANHAASLTVLQYNPADYDPAPWTLSDVQLAVWPGGTRSWLMDTQPVSARDTTAKTFTTTNQGKFDYALFGVGSRYYVQGILDLLTAAGEWYLDRATGDLYYWARDGAIASQEIVIPTAKEAVTITGASAASHASYITLDGLEIRYGDFIPFYRNGYPFDGTTILGPGGHTDNNYAYFASIPEAQFGLVHLKHTDNITITNCHVKNAGLHGIYMDGAGTSNTVSATLIERTGLSGIRCDNSWPGEGDILTGNRITNFKVLRCGEVAGGSSGIELANCGNNEVDHGYMQYGSRKALWVFADSGIATTLVYAGGNNVHHIKAENFNDDSGDTGTFGVSSLSSRLGGPYVQTTFTQIIVNNVHAHPSMTDVAPDGFFCDDETYRTILNYCQATNIQGSQFRLNNSGEPILTGCSFKADGTADPAFNPALMDTANIGVQSGFPY